jgi:hypothetical protein
MFLRPHQLTQDGKDRTYWSLVETVRTAAGPRQKTLCYLGELNSSAHARWLKTIEVFNEHGEAQQLTEAEASFRALKSELSIRLLFHQLESRVKAHVMVAFLGYALWVTLKHLLEAPAGDRSGAGQERSQHPSAAFPDESAGFAVHATKRRHRAPHHRRPRDPPPPRHRTRCRTEISSAAARHHPPRSLATQSKM